MRKEELAKKMSRSDKKYEHKAMRHEGKMLGGDMKPLNRKQIVSHLKGRSKVANEMHHYRQHEGVE